MPKDKPAATGKKKKKMVRRKKKKVEPEEVPIVVEAKQKDIAV